MSPVLLCSPCAQPLSVQVPASLVHSLHLHGHQQQYYHGSSARISRGSGVDRSSRRVHSGFCEVLAIAPAYSKVQRSAKTHSVHNYAIIDRVRACITNLSHTRTGNTPHAQISPCSLASLRCTSHLSSSKFLLFLTAKTFLIFLESKLACCRVRAGRKGGEGLARERESGIGNGQFLECRRGSINNDLHHNSNNLASAPTCPELTARRAASPATPTSSK